MQGGARRDVLACVLGELFELTPRDRRARAAELARRLREDRLRVLVVGEAKRGKSTVVNALLGRAVLPSGVTPLTAIATAVAYGAVEQVDVQTHDGRSECYPLDALPDLVTEDGNPHNRRGLAGVVVQLDAPLLAEGIELVDTPGTGSVFEHNTVTARAALEAMDAAVFVLTADPPISEVERELLSRVRAASVATFVVLNKIDRLDQVERASAVAFTEQVVGPGNRVYPCSARAALSEAGVCTDAADASSDDIGADGFRDFAADFTRYLRRDRARGLRRSLTRQAADWADTLRDEVQVTLRADELRRKADTARVEAFRAELVATDRRRREAVDLVHAEAGHLLAQLNTEAEHVVASIGAQVRARLDEMIAGPWARASAAQIDEWGRALATRTVAELVEPWRTRQAAALERDLEQLDERLRSGIERDLGAIRDAARTLLGTQLALPAAQVRLVADPRFHYAPPRPQGPTETVAVAVRRHLLGRLGREHAAAVVRAQVAESADRMVGRARGDLQFRLAETARTAAQAVVDRYTQYAAHLTSALDAARNMSTLTCAEAESARSALIERHHRLNGLLRRLSELSENAHAEPDEAVQPG